MATRSANNLIAGGIQNHGAPIHYFVIDGGAAIAGETNPGEAMEAIVETIQQTGNIVEIGALDGPGTGQFRVGIENNGITAADLQTAIRALGASVGSGNYDASGATVADFAM
tara:strand:+ start:305 stop:640 length:336 start_codon:yes stop_codon:yes gene_type:complete